MAKMENTDIEIVPEQHEEIVPEADPQSEEDQTANPAAVEDPKDSVTHARIIESIKKSRRWRILVYGLTEEQNSYHSQLLDGIMGKQLQLTADSKEHEIQKNGTKVEIKIGSHPECNITHENVDLLLVFILMERAKIDKAFFRLAAQITQARGAEVWRHSVVVLTGIDVIANEHTGQGIAAARFAGLLDGLRAQILTAVELAQTGDEQEVGIRDNQILVAGQQIQPDLPKPHEKWFSQLCLSCYLFSKKDSIPAILKLSQARIANSVDNNKIARLAFYEQPIQVKEDYARLFNRDKVHLGIGRNGAIVVDSSKDEPCALVGALTLGISSFSTVATTGLPPGAAGGVGVEVTGFAAVGSIASARNQHQQQQVRHRRIEEHYAELFACFPSISNHLMKWTEKQKICRIVVAGFKEEGATNLASALTNQSHRRRGSGLFWEGIESNTANLIVHDFPSFESPIHENINHKTLELFKLMKEKEVNLLIFCIKVTPELKETFAKSWLKNYFVHLHDHDREIFSNLVIALTFADKLRDSYDNGPSQREQFQKYFENEVAGWRLQINTELQEHFRAGGVADIPDIPVIPVSVSDLENNEINLSDNEASDPAKHYHWLSKLLVEAMPVTKPEGLPTLIKTIKKRFREKHPDIQIESIDEQLKEPDAHQPQVNVTELENTRELITEAQCSMFSQIGLRDKKQAGEAVGLILGVREKIIDHHQKL